jgi:hypothetical protein
LHFGSLFIKKSSAGAVSVNAYAGVHFHPAAVSKFMQACIFAPQSSASLCKRAFSSRSRQQAYAGVHFRPAAVSRLMQGLYRPNENFIDLTIELLK